MVILLKPTRAATALPGGLHALPTAASPPPPPEPSEEGDEQAGIAVVREVTAAVAGVPAHTIRARESIYAYGIDSIAAIRLAAGCRQRGIQLGAADILQGDSLAVIYWRHCSRLPAEPVSAAVRATALEVLGVSAAAVLPVLGGQQFRPERWLQSGRTLYEPTWTFRARERLDMVRLRAAWRALRRRHAVLRTVFAAVAPDRAVQVQLAPATVAAAPACTVSDEPGPAAPAVRAAVLRLARSPSDLFSLPARLHVVCAADCDVLLLAPHHAVYDAWSVPTWPT